MDEDKVPYKNPLAGLGLDGVQKLLKERLAILPHGYKLPYMQWYEDDFKSSDGVEELAPLARLMYRQLLAKAWVSKEAPYLPSDKERLFRLADCPDEESWARYSKQVLAMFQKTSDKKKLFHARQLLDYTAQIVKISANTINGRKGGRPSISNKTKGNQKTQIKPTENPTETQPELESEPKPEAELELESEPKTANNSASFGQETDMKPDKQIEILTEQFFGKRANLRGWNVDELKKLTTIHKGSAVVRAFGEWAALNSDNPDISDPVHSFLREADELLSGGSPTQAAAKDPQTVNLARELAYLSDGQLAFTDKQRIRLSEVLQEFNAEEIISAFKAWFADQDLTDPKTLKWGANEFVQKVDGIAYAARRKNQERAQAEKQREIVARRLQEQAEAERREREKANAAEAESFDPLADL